MKDALESSQSSEEVTIINRALTLITLRPLLADQDKVMRDAAEQTGNLVLKKPLPSMEEMSAGIQQIESIMNYYDNKQALVANEVSRLQTVMQCADSAPPLFVI